MPFDLSPAFIDQLDSSGAASPVLFVELAFANETLYLFNGVGTITPAGPAYSALATFPYGQAFTGMGWLGKVSAVPQTTRVQAQNVTFALSGLTPAMVTEAINFVRITGAGTLWLGYIDSSGNVIPDPVQLFAGATDQPTLNDSGETSTIELTCENPLILLGEAPARMFDDADQQIYFPGDLGMSFVDALPQLNIFWPSPASWGGTYPIDAYLAPSTADIGVGGTVTISVTITYSNGSTYTQPGNIGSGPPFSARLSSNNPKIATVDASFVVHGVKPGACIVMVRVPVILGGANTSEKRAACAVIVHS
jgi:hypothetical protein